MLTRDYTPFGTVRIGMQLLDEVARAGHDGREHSGDGRPKTTLVIRSMTIS